MNKAVRIGLAVGILALGIGANQYMVKTKPQPEKKEVVDIGVPVEVKTIQKGDPNVLVRTRGTVIPSHQAILGTEVSGKVIGIHPNLEPGGRFQEGETLVKVNPADYRIALEQQFAAIDNAQAQLSLEESRKAVAEREWEMFGKKGEAKGNRSMALREPQLQSAKTQLKAAKSGLKRARLGVERTLLRAPFDGIVQQVNVGLGQIVAPGAGLIRYVATDTYWVQISLPIERLSWISIPGVAGATEGSDVEVRYEMGEDAIVRKGRVLRLLGEVDPAGGMARVLVEIEDPLGLKSEIEGAKVPLLLGTYVEVTIKGTPMDNVVELDRAALRNGDSVFVMSAKGTLDIRPVNVLWRQESSVMVSSGVQAGDKVIVSPISAPVAGMKLRVPEARAVAPSSDKSGSKEDKSAAQPEATAKVQGGDATQEVRQ